MEKDKENNGTFEDLSLKDNLLRGIYSYGFDIVLTLELCEFLCRLIFPGHGQIQNRLVR